MREPQDVPVVFEGFGGAGVVETALAAGAEEFTGEKGGETEERVEAAGEGGGVRGGVRGVVAEVFVVDFGADHGCSWRVKEERGGWGGILDGWGGRVV